MVNNAKRLIEVAFPLKQVSLDAVHEKNVRHGHISTLHIWPARRPLAAARAALIATLLPDPGNAAKRQEILERMAGRVVETIKRKRVNGRVVEETKEETAGGILHWGRENGSDLDWFRTEIRKAYGGRAPKVLDPFAGGGAIPLEAMRLGCEDHRHGYQPRRLVHPEMHSRIPSTARRADRARCPSSPSQATASSWRRSLRLRASRATNLRASLAAAGPRRWMRKCPT